MSPGKLAAQVAHAAVEAYRVSDPELVRVWYLGGHYTKLVMLAKSERELDSIERYLNDRDFQTALVIDEGRTEIEPFTSTALGVEIVDKDDPRTKATFSQFKLYRE